MTTVAANIRDTLDTNPIVGTAKTGTRRFWTNQEEKKLRDNYPEKGLEGCIPLLPGRSASSIYNRVGLLGLQKKVASSHDFRRQKWTSNDQIDAIIRRVYQSTPTKNQVKECAAIVSRPRWWVSKRAVKLGLVLPRFREPPWATTEIEYVTENAHKSATVIRRGLKARGFKRSDTAIMVKLKRIGTPTGRNADTEHYSANQLAKLFGIDNHGVTAWIKKGWLKAERRGTGRTSQQGGDEYKVHRKAVRSFVIGNAAAIDIRKVDKFWFIDLLAERDTR